MAIFLWGVIGLLAGWLVTLLFGRRGGGLPNNLMLGVVGGVVGGLLFTHLSTAARPSFFGSLGTAIVGAIVVLAVWRAVKRA